MSERASKYDILGTREAQRAAYRKRKDPFKRDSFNAVTDQVVDLLNQPGGEGVKKAIADRLIQEREFGINRGADANAQELISLNEQLKAAKTDEERVAIQTRIKLLLDSKAVTEF